MKSNHCKWTDALLAIELVKTRSLTPALSPRRGRIVAEIEHPLPGERAGVRADNTPHHLNLTKRQWGTFLAVALTTTLALTLKAAEPNTLTDAEKKAGWKLLFDGKTTTGWRGYKMDKMPPGWSVIDGVLVRVKGGEGGKGAGGGDDIVTTEEFENFDLQLEWKTVPSGNSGVLYHVSEEPITAWHYAPEVQILDNTAHPTRSKLELAAACYDLYAPTKDMTKPLGQWNHMRILVDGAHVEHWLNGEKVVEYELWSDDWKQRVAKSKHKGRPQFGTFKKGPIALQDHTDRLEFRNIKIRVLPAKESR